MMRNLVFGFSLIAALCTWFFYETMQVFERSSIAPAPAVASVKLVQGTVRARSAGQSEWREVLPNMALRKGDTVFVGEGAKLVYTYRHDNATIQLPSNSIQEITETPQVASKLARAFYATSSIGERPAGGAKLRKKRIYVRMEQKPGGAAPQGASAEAQDEEASATFKLEKQSRALRIREPAGNVRIVSDEAPLALRVSFDRPEDAGRIFGFLWRKDGEARPLWSEVLENPVFDKVPLPEPGSYIFQAVSEDDSYVSPLVEVTLEREKTTPSEIVAGAFSATDWAGKRVLVLR